MNKPNDNRIKRILRNEQDKYVTAMIVSDTNMKLSEAIKIWYNSKTRKFIQDNQQYRSIRAATPARCYFELKLELAHDPNWMTEEFE